MEPVEEPSEALARYPKRVGESGQPRQLDDQPAQVAELLGRQNAAYDSVWDAAVNAYPRWAVVECNSYRRALLLASSATQHRTKAFQVKRRGRLVCIRLIPDDEVNALDGQLVSATG